MPGQKRRQVLKTLTEAAARHQNFKWEEHSEDTFVKTWRDTAMYGGAKKLNTPQIGGQEHGQGPDILKFIKKFDPNNESGTVKKALDIMTKLQESAKSGQLNQALQPLENILGGDLFGAMKAAGAQTTASEKVAETKEEDFDIMELIAAALARCNEHDRITASNLLDESEISLISDAYYGNHTYTSAKVGMPAAFVEAINYLIPIFRSREGL